MKASNAFGRALQEHAGRRGLKLPSTEAALGMLFRFLEQEQVALLLDSAPIASNGVYATPRERAVIAEFVQDAIAHDPAMQAVLRGILEGLVLYQAAFLPDLNAVTRHFKDLRVAFDSGLVRQAIGYEGVAMRALLRDTIDVLKTDGVQCFVFDKTLDEIRRLLRMYEGKLRTAEGRKSLRAFPMARHFLTERYSPSDLRQMAALLEQDVSAAGFQIKETPRRIPKYVGSEKKLTDRLSNPTTRDELEPRVVHDVDCVAAIMTFRRGHRSSNLEDARAVFATSSSLVIWNTRLWYEEDEHETGVEPAIHIRALTNLAWLKKPKLCEELKVRELVAMCTAALRPTVETWRRFLRHLESLEKSEKLTADETMAILVSAMSDQLLREAEGDGEDPADIDMVTLDEIVDRVKASYGATLTDKVQEVTEQYESRLAAAEARTRVARARAEAVERATTEEARQRELFCQDRAQRRARQVAGCMQGILTVGVFAGAAALFVGHAFQTNWIGLILAGAVLLFLLLETVGILKHVSEWRRSMEARLTMRFRDRLNRDYALLRYPKVAGRRSPE
jgi:hypothetical protein